MFSCVLSVYSFCLFTSFSFDLEGQSSLNVLIIVLPPSYWLLYSNS